MGIWTQLTDPPKSPIRKTVFALAASVSGSRNSTLHESFSKVLLITTATPPRFAPSNWSCPGYELEQPEGQVGQVIDTDC